ncbi:hypothetical protein FUAX_45810 (plasmid) [Fulvitalea axinellae]|uniref:DUF5007 domain-containing protein n=1 Tax=Fulvitalea axinellae TaxID=1182444 RepID=A0AAU9CJ50_9BACT|nr:hypothetical protein FUAX_45810 [Fulvitalea axinellae]
MKALSRFSILILLAGVFGACGSDEAQNKLNDELQMIVTSSEGNHSVWQPLHVDMTFANADRLSTVSLVREDKVTDSHLVTNLTEGMFSFTYTPVAADAGKTVKFKVSASLDNNVQAEKEFQVTFSKFPTANQMFKGQATLQGNNVNYQISHNSLNANASTANTDIIKKRETLYGTYLTNAISNIDFYIVYPINGSNWSLEDGSTAEGLYKIFNTELPGQKKYTDQDILFPATFLLPIVSGFPTTPNSVIAFKTKSGRYGVLQAKVNNAEDYTISVEMNAFTINAETNF